MADHDDDDESATDEKKKKGKRRPIPEERASVTHHEVTIGGRRIAYTATAGTLLLKREKDEPEAEVFYVSYVKDAITDPASRPVTFAFNGGPGSSAVWLHLGTFGPRRVSIPDAVQPPPPPYRLVENEHSILDVTDLVFIDPVATGYSRVVGDGKPEDFLGVDNDITSMAEMIRLWTTRHARWASPKVLAGESYGTFRVAGLLDRLQDDGMFCNGAILVSLALDIGLLEFEPANDLAAIVHLPTYAATAWYHDALEERPSDLHAWLAEVREFAISDYSVALLRGSKLDPAARAGVAKKLARYTGLSVEYVERSNLRIETQRFCKELLRARGRTVGRLDTRYTGIDRNAVDQEPEHDPSYTALLGPYAAVLQDYLRRELGFAEDRPYTVMNMKANEDWKWEVEGHLGYPVTATRLRKVMATNTHLEVLAANGIFDLATPFFAAEHAIGHLGLPAEHMGRVHMKYYDSGHMMYVHPPSLAALKRDVQELFGRFAR